MDVLRDLGAFAFASRLKRLGDRLKMEASHVYSENGIEFNDSWFLAGYMLSLHKRMTVTEMARALDISPPAISQVSSDMVKSGIIAVETDRTDKRKRILVLTDKGSAVIEKLAPLWEAIAKVTEEMIETTGYDILNGISTLEADLDEKSLLDRVNEKLNNGGV